MNGDLIIILIIVIPTPIIITTIIVVTLFESNVTLLQLTLGLNARVERILLAD